MLVDLIDGIMHGLLVICLGSWMDDSDSPTLIGFCVCRLAPELLVVRRGQLELSRAVRLGLYSLSDKWREVLIYV